MEMSSPTSPDQEETLNSFIPDELDKENSLEPLIPKDQEIPNLSQQNDETLDVILHKKDQGNPNAGTADSSSHFSLTVAVDTGLSVPEPPPLMSPTNTNKRNKLKKGKRYTNKLQAMERKLETLKENLNPVPFLPSVSLDFVRHEKLLRLLGLWDFVHVEFDRDLRVDFIAELIATFDNKVRCSYVNGSKILVNRADLARAFNMHTRRGAAAVDALELDAELSEVSISFLENVVSYWMLLHGDTWIMPKEIVNWMKSIKDGHPEKVDWAGLLWFMVDKEITQGGQLVDCYYASHLQHLIKHQREDLFSEEPGKMEFEADLNLEDNCGNKENARAGGSNEAQEADGGLVEGLHIELTLAQETQEAKDVEMMDDEEHKEEVKDEEEKPWLSDERTDANVPLLQRCNMQEAMTLDDDDVEKKEHEMEDVDDDVEKKEHEMENVDDDVEKKEHEMEDVDDDVEEEEEDRESAERNEVEDEFDAMPGDDDGLTGNFLQTMESTQIALHNDQSAVELLASGAEMLTGGQFFGSGSKRNIEIDHDMVNHSLNKRLRIEDAWNQKPLDFGLSMEQIQHLAMNGKVMFEEKEQEEEQFILNQQVLLNKLHERDSEMEHLHRSRYEELQKRDGEIIRLERELSIMGKIVYRYRKASQGISRQFSDYRQKFELPEEPYYKDAGPGGLMLSTAELERLRLKQEEENRTNRLFLEQIAKEADEKYASQFEGFWLKVHMMDKKLTNLGDEVKNLRNLRAKCGVVESNDESNDRISETPDGPPNE